MSKSKYKTYDDLKQDFLGEMDFISNIGAKFFIYLSKSHSKLSTNGFYFTYGLLFLVTTQLIATLCLICINNFDWFEVINVTPNTGVCMMILVKYVKIHKNKEVYDEIFKHFRFDLWEAIADTTEHKLILNRFIMVYQNNIVGKEKQYLYPFDGWYPFDKQQWYNTAYIWESFMTTVVIFIFVFINILHISFTRYICMELKILGNTMEGLITDDDVVKIKGGKETEQTHYKIKTKLKFIISKHQYLAKIISDLDNVLGDGMFLTYAFGSVFICLTAFTATVVDDLYKSMRYFSFFCSLLLEVFIQCIMGQLLSDHSNKLEKAIYFADWVYADSDTKKMLLIFLMRVQKPFEFSAKGYLNMNLEAFSGICSLSYQFFNLLRTAYSE
ncbi:hypothetical protein PYW07_002145 [Mythimna separata]|uniref:Odorant receptor n=1 Tax=Mythimna separata TaxID=271217 RepID=A0AAD7YP03_MYTSE|nr:hypothetical protein PYW07_002145 [Mythimna separata]